MREGQYVLMSVLASCLLLGACRGASSGGAGGSDAAGDASLDSSGNGEGGQLATDGGAGVGGTLGAGGTPAAGGASGHSGREVRVCVSDGFVDLLVSAAGFAEHEGRTVYLYVTTQGGQMLGTASAVVRAGVFSARFPNGYQRNAVETLLWYVDSDGDGRCLSANGDHVGHQSIDAFAVTGTEPHQIDIVDNHDDSFSPSDPNMCTGIKEFARMMDLEISGSGFNEHEGQPVYLITRTSRNNAVFAAAQATVAAGAFQFAFRRAYERFTYQEVLWFTDVDGDGVCGPADHVGYASTNGDNPVASQLSQVKIKDNHAATTARNADVCAAMNGCPP